MRTLPRRSSPPPPATPSAGQVSHPPLPSSSIGPIVSSSVPLPVLPPHRPAISSKPLSFFSLFFFIVILPRVQPARAATNLHELVRRRLKGPSDPRTSAHAALIGPPRTEWKNASYLARPSIAPLADRCAAAPGINTSGRELHFFHSVGWRLVLCFDREEASRRRRNLSDRVSLKPLQPPLWWHVRIKCLRVT